VVSRGLGDKTQEVLRGVVHLSGILSVDKITDSSLT
jgi:hypothetical protein